MDSIIPKKIFELGNALLSKVILKELPKKICPLIYDCIKFFSLIIYETIGYVFIHKLIFRILVRYVIHIQIKSQKEII